MAWWACSDSWSVSNQAVDFDRLPNPVLARLEQEAEDDMTKKDTALGSLKGIKFTLLN